MKKGTIKKWLIICAGIVLFCLLVTQLLVISDLSQKIEDLNQRVYSLPTNTTTTVIEQKESLIIDTDTSYGNIDTEKHTIDYSVRVLPRTITQDLKISLSVGDINYKLKKNGNYYEVTIPLYLFLSGVEEDSSFLMIEMNDETHIERFDSMVVNSLYDYCIATFYPNGSNSHRFSGNKLIVDYTVDINIYKNSFLSLDEIADYTKIDMVTELNGKEIEREDKTNEILENQHHVLGGNFSGKKTYENFDKEKNRLHIYFEAVDELGYIHKHSFLYIAPDDKYGKDDQYYNVYDQEGNALIIFEE